MKLVHVLALAAFAFAAAPASAGPDDEKWIKQCEHDNRNEGAKPEVVTKYCTCMNDKMDNSETRTITQWEKANPKARDECSRRAGWK